ncbi:MAG: hypothetical protein RLT05_17030, partial [Bauldia litoralis]
ASAACASCPVEGDLFKPDSPTLRLGRCRVIGELADATIGRVDRQVIESRAAIRRSGRCAGSGQISIIDRTITAREHERDIKGEP